MTTSIEVSVPSFDFSSFYYPEILRSLIQYQRVYVPEITSEDDEEPFQQLLRAYALVGHLNNVLLDVVANESLLPTARLLESIRGHLALIDVTLAQASPATTELVLEFSKVFTIQTEIVPVDSQFATKETEDEGQIIYENDEAKIIEPTDEIPYLYSYTTGKIKILDNSFDVGDAITIAGVSFTYNVDWVAGAAIADTLQNITDAINDSEHVDIQDLIGTINDGVDEISVIPLDDSIEAITITETDNATDNFEVQSAAFGLNKASSANTDSVLFDLFDYDPKAGDMVYFMHTDIMWDTLDFLFDTFGSGLEFVLEYYDNALEDQKPDTVTNLGSQLEFDLTTLLGTEDRSNTVVRVLLSTSGASERVITEYVGGKNIAVTRGLLGQAVVSTDRDDYFIGSTWNEVSSYNDDTLKFTEDGVIDFTLPQTRDENWTSGSVNGQQGFWLRLRVISVSSPINPTLDRVRIDTGKQYLLVTVFQGETVADSPLGSSNGGTNQEFVLTFDPLIQDTLTVEVNEGAGFEEWDAVDNFLNSTSISKHYKVDISADNIATIIFGDGIQGKIPDPGVDNIRAIYRIGADQDGNVGANTITVNKSGISFVNRIYNPRQANGWTVKEGSTDEDKARLKIEGPASIRNLGKAITPSDIEELAVAFTDSNGSRIVARALAIEETFGVKTIELVVVGQEGTLLTESQRDELEEYFNGNKAEGIEGVLLANHEVTVINYTPKDMNVIATVTGGNEEEIKNAMAALLNPTAKFDDGVTYRWDFEDEVPSSVISAEIFDVDQANIRKVVLTSPPDTQLDARELPLININQITVI